jgi:rhodanese-related sulfurtransferase
MPGADTQTASQSIKLYKPFQLFFNQVIKVTVMNNPNAVPLYYQLNQENMIREITVQDLKKMRDENADFQLIDVREVSEYQMSNIGGELIPLGTLPNQLDKVARDKTVVVHCRSGARSAQAVNFLQHQGYDNLYNLAGGIMAWAREIDSSIPVA